MTVLDRYHQDDDCAGCDGATTTVREAGAFIGSGVDSRSAGPPCRPFGIGIARWSAGPSMVQMVFGETRQDGSACAVAGTARMAAASNKRFMVSPLLDQRLDDDGYGEHDADKELQHEEP
jgi:hypothetical protein